MKIKEKEGRVSDKREHERKDNEALHNEELA